MPHLCALVFLLIAIPSYARDENIIRTIVIETPGECGDTCAFVVRHRKAANEIYLCDGKSMQSGTRVPVCIDIFGLNGSAPNRAQGRTATLTLKQDRPGSVDYWIVGGHLQPSAGAAKSTASGSRERNQHQQGGEWDSWLEATGNKTKVAPPTSPSAVKTTGTAPASVEAVIKSCQHLVNVTGPGKPGIGSIFAIDYLAPVDASTVYGNMGPQGKLVPLKLYAKYRDGEKLYANGYLQKDPFGDFKCIQAR